MYRVNIVNSGDSVFEVASGNYSFTVDTKGRGITPPDTLLASLGTCVGVYIRKYVEGAKLDLKEFAITVEAEFTQDKPARFQKINVLLDFKGALLDERRIKAMLEFVKNCPVHNTLESKPEVEIRVANG